MRSFTQSKVSVNRLNTSSPEGMLIENFLGIWNKSAGKKYLPADSEAIGATDCPYWQFYIGLSIYENKDWMRGAEYILIYSFGVCRRDGEHALFEEGAKKYSSVTPHTRSIFNGYDLLYIFKDKVQFHHLLGPEFFAHFLFAGVDVFAVNLINEHLNEVALGKLVFSDDTRR